MIRQLSVSVSFIKDEIMKPKKNLLRTKSSISFALAFHVSVRYLSYFSACDRYKENRVLEESVNEESSSDVGVKIPLVPF